MNGDLTASGIDRATADLAEVRERGDDLRPALKEIAEDFRTGVMARQFSTGGSLTGGWVPHTPGYRARKQRDRPGRRTGVYTGVMERSLTTRSGGYQRITRSRMEAGSNASPRGGRRHTQLFSQGRGGQAARPLVPPAPVLARRWSPVLDRYLAGDSYTGVV